MRPADSKLDFAMADVSFKIAFKKIIFKASLQDSDEIVNESPSTSDGHTHMLSTN